MIWLARCLAVFAFATAGYAAVPDCETLARTIGQRAGLPDGFLPAIARIESGRSQQGTRRAWPWTLNHAGKGLYFETRAEAMQYLRKAVQAGRTNIDVGCMQVNHYWHAENFAALDKMMDPQENITYAAGFLKDLYRQHGSWVEAVKHYHSPDDARGARYFKGFETAQKQMKTNPGAPLVAAAMSQGGGFFDLGQIGAGRSEMGLLSKGSQDIDAMYGALIAALGPQDGAEFTIWSAPGQMTPADQTRGVLRRKWDLVQTFRQDLARQQP